MSPLTRRFPRELRNNLGKYIGMFLMMVITISITSGFLSASSSIEKITDAMRDDYNVEDGRFTTSFEASSGAIRAVEDLGATVYELFSYDLVMEIGDTTSNGSDSSGMNGSAVTESDGSESSTTLHARMYEHRTEVNIAAYAEGRAPETTTEIALDRVFCANNDLAMGDTVTIAGTPYTIVGILTLPDYQALFENNTSFVFNAISFTVAEVTPEAFASLENNDEAGMSYTYAFTLDNRSMQLSDRVDVETEMADVLSSAGVTVTDFMDYTANQGVGYAADDIEGDRSMWITLALILIVIMAFMFVVLTANTIEEESAVIGTLMASGYRKTELLRHYMLLPTAVGVVAAAVGLLLGNTLLVNPMKGLYYNSYSLPPYVPTWDWGVFAFTAVVPLALLILITFLGLVRKLRFTPLQFLRHDIGRGNSKHGLNLPDKLGFVTRFRVRVFVRNLGNFATLFFGIAFASLILIFGLCIMPTMQNYASQLRNTVAAEHMYTLKAPLELEGTAAERQAWKAAELLATTKDIGDLDLTASNLFSTLLAASTIDAEDEDVHPVNTIENSEEAIAQAEKFAAYSLELDRGGDYGQESITIYGIQENSTYWADVDVSTSASEFTSRNADDASGTDAIDASPYTVTIGKGLASKFHLSVDSSLTLHDPYQNEDHTFTVGSVYGENTDMNVYLSIAAFNAEFDYDADYFNGYASDLELQLDTLYLSSEITPADMDKVAAQMNDSMDNMADMMLGLAVAIFLIFMYLLTKTVIDRSARAISYMKVFGYRDGEINKLYLRSITLTVAASLVLCMPILIYGIGAIFTAMMYRYSGNLEVYVPLWVMAFNLAVGLVTYAIIAFVHTRSIKRVPLSLALKVQE